MSQGDLSGAHRDHPGGCEPSLPWPMSWKYPNSQRLRVNNPRRRTAVAAFFIRDTETVPPRSGVDHPAGANRCQNYRKDRSTGMTSNRNMGSRGGNDEQLDLPPSALARYAEGEERRRAVA